MKMPLPLVLSFKMAIAIVSFCLVTDSIAATSSDKQSASGSRKTGVTIPARKYYKGEIENHSYASNVVPVESKYSGQVFNSDLYQGAIKGPAYFPRSNRSLHDGFYIGVAAGYDSYKMRHSINIIQNGSSVFQQNPELSAVGLSYTFLGGYGRYFDEPLYIGMEFFYNYSQANTSQNVGLYNGVSGIYYVKSLILGNYGLSLMPGIKLSDSALLYLRGGYTRLEVKTYETSAALNVNNGQSNGVNGYHFGLGIEADIYKNWSIRGEYTHLNSDNFKTHVGTIVTPSDNQFMLGLILHFI